MSKIGVIGHVACPVCDHADAHVKHDKGGYAYIVCPDCGAQCFTRNDFRSNKLKARMRPVQNSTVQAEPPAQTVQPEQKQVKQPVQPAKAPAVPKAPPGQKNAPAVDPAPPAPKKKAGWFQPLIGGDA